MRNHGQIFVPRAVHFFQGPLFDDDLTESDSASASSQPYTRHHHQQQQQHYSNARTHQDANDLLDQALFAQHHQQQVVHRGDGSVGMGMGMISTDPFYFSAYAAQPTT